MQIQTTAGYAVALKLLVANGHLTACFDAVKKTLPMHLNLKTKNCLLYIVLCRSFYRINFLSNASLAS